MPLHLYPPRPGRSPNWTIRGRYLRVRVNRTSGTSKRAVAQAILAAIEAEIELGEYQRKPQADRLTFGEAALAYIKATDNKRYVGKLVERFGRTPLDEIDQAAIDQAALELYPDVTGATRNVCVYTPMSAILHHAGVKITLRRPPGAKGRMRTDWLNPADAQAIIAAAEALDPEFGDLLLFLLYTGARIGEALSLTWEYVAADTAYFAEPTKNDDPRSMKLQADLAALLYARRQASGRVWRWHQGGRLKGLLLDAKLMACGLPKLARPKKGERRRVPPHRLSWVTFHSFRHTWATWMRRFGGTDVKGLVATGNWRDERSAKRYLHVAAADEWDRVEKLPVMRRRRAE